ncbi:MAG TPA: ISL3 family transposase [Stellaceae bacterium]|jgi:transposase|nr:ISL3 family transposase [Stellaceae bacterium]
MSDKHTIDEQRVRENELKQGIIVPLDLPEFEILSQSMGSGESIEVHVRAKQESAACPRCGEESRKVHDIRKRIKRDMRLGTYQVYLVVHKRRFGCATCGKPFTESDHACGRYKRTTQRLRDHIAKQACQRPITHVAQEVQVGPRFVHGCLQAWIEEKLKKKGRTLGEQTKLPTPQILGIDEFALRKGHHYDTILCDLESRDVLEVGEGRKKEEVIVLLGRLSNPDAVKAVSMDMSASFRPAVQEALPKAQIVVDHFHVIQHIMKAFRKVVSSFAHKKEGMVLLHKKQHLFLRGSENLNQEETQQRERIGARLPLLEKAWQLKEALRAWYATATVADAAERLDTWIKHVQQEGPEALQKALSPFKNWRQEILAFFEYLPVLVSNGFVEGKNNRTKAIMRQAYGYRNRYNLRMRILLGAGT